ncbi:MAG: cytochrome c3 family protein [Planctomycetota bacterium]|nr:cytochrome c3 family protein [Planctomycetota bacterium]
MPAHPRVRRGDLREARRRLVVALSIASILVVGLGGCVAIWKALFGQKSRSFSHRQHMDARMGFLLECSDCHEPILDGAKYSIRGHPACQECHEDDVGDEPQERCLLCHQTESPPPAQIRDFLGGERIFSHGEHEQLECDSCHREQGFGGKSMTITSMVECIQCHESSDATIECESCHRQIRKNLEPPSHDEFFVYNHGRVANLTRGYCDFCHVEDDCSSCHATMKPKSHTYRWKDMGHGIYAVREKQSCTVCHTGDDCEECHSIRPQTHMRPSWDLGPGHRDQARLNIRACFACHDFTDTCEACHPGRDDIDLIRKR